MKKFLKNVLLILFFSLMILFFNQSLVKAVEVNTINSIEELKTAVGEKATIEGNTIKLTDNVILNDELLDIKIPEVIIDFNGKTIEITTDIMIYNKITFKDSSTTNRLNWGGIIFNRPTYGGVSSAQIKVVGNAELTIENGKFVAGNKNDITSRLFYIAGKLTINDATFSTERSKSVPYYDNYMIFLDSNSECVINNGEFTNTETLIKIGEVPCWNGKDYNDYIFFNKCRLTINGGKFSCLDESAIKIYAFYPYNENKEVVTPKIKLNNCDIKAKNSAIVFYGGCMEEQFRNEKTEILTISGGTYSCSKQSIGAPIEIQTEHSDINTYFNPKDFVLQGGTFESLNNTKGALGLIGPRRR